jgi:Cu2+-exporting ATPase/Cu+-exporting ATPase
MDFFLEGIHCIACLSVIERLHEFDPGVQSSRLDIGRSIVHVTLKPDGKFSRAAAWLDRLGYSPHAITTDQQTQLLQKKEEKKLLLRLGVAGICAANVMLLAISLYGGATGATAEKFKWLSLILSLPVLFFSAVPFYTSAWTAIKNKKISIDIPMVLAILTSSIWSITHVVTGISDEIYFDSVTALVFLLLSTRYILKRSLHEQLMAPSLLSYLTAASQKLKAGDLITIKTGGRIPCDGVLRSSSALLNLSVLTGESVPLQVQSGEPVYMGTQNEAHAVEIEVTALGEDTRLGKTLKKAQETVKRAQLVSLGDKISQKLVLLVGALAIGVILYFAQTNPAEGLRRAMAMLVLACPCGLALALPLAYSRSLKEAAQRGLLIKSAETLDAILNVQDVFFDKTGTLTQGHLELKELRMLVTEEKIKIPLQDAIVALETHSQHPIARAFVRYMNPSNKTPEPVSGLKETLGKGIEGFVFGHLVQIISSDQAGTSVGIWVDGEQVAQATFSDQLRSDSLPTIQALYGLNLRPHIISGDHSNAVQNISHLLEIKPSRSHARLLPDEKLTLIKKSNHAMMVGDGANDAAALKAAHVGVAVQGSLELSLQSADVYSTLPGVAPVIDLFKIARKNKTRIYRVFAISFFYNVIGLTLALTGWISPLAAALLMPLSSISSTIGAQK